MTTEVVETRYYIGCDPAKKRDWAGIGCLEKTIEYDFIEHKYVTSHAVIHIERFKELEYPALVAYLETLFLAPKLRDNKSELVIDCRGVGEAVYDMLVNKELAPIAVLATGGLEVVNVGNMGIRFHVPKVFLVDALQILFQSGTLAIADLPESPQLQKELELYKVRTNLRTGYERFEAETEGVHDDLVECLQLAAWYAHRDFTAPKQFIGLPEKQEPYDVLRWGME